MTRRSSICLAILLAALLAAPVKANQVDAPDEGAGFSEQKAAIIQKLNDGSTYAQISPEDRSQVLQALDRMERLLAGRSPDALNEDERIAVFNNQEIVHVLLTRAERDSQVVCTRGRTVGTHFRATRCETLAERRNRHEVTELALQRLHKGTIDGGGNLAPGTVRPVLP